MALTIALLAQPLPSPHLEPEFLMVAADLPSTNERYRARPLDVCGRVVQQAHRPGEAILSANGNGIYVDAASMPLPVGTATCIKGIMLRRDGYTDQEAREQGRYVVVVHGIHPHYLFYRCDTVAACTAIRDRLRGARGERGATSRQDAQEVASVR